MYHPSPRTWLLSRVAGCTVLAVCLFRADSLPAQTGSTVSTPGHASVIGGAVLLKNLRVIEGQIVPNGDLLTVQMGQGAKVSLPLSEVLHVADDKEAIYQFRCQKRGGPEWREGDDFKMSKWCLVNGLYDQAIEHYEAVAEFYPNDPNVKQLALEVRNRLLSIPEFRRHLGFTDEPKPAGNKTSRIAAQGRTAANSAVSMASGHSAVAAMHPQIAAHFSRRIQPILMNRCSQAACHGAQSKNNLRIVEPYRAAYDRVTAENLESVLGQVSSDSQTLAPLLRLATTAHGMQRQAAIAVTETSLLQELSTWVRFVQNPVATAQATGTANQASAVRTAQASQFTPFTPSVKLVPVQPGASGLRPVPNPNGLATPANPGQAVNKSFPGSDAPSLSEIDALDQQLRQILGEAPLEKATGGATNRGAMTSNSPVQPSTTTSSQPATGNDPFDPSEFNRQRLRSSRGQ